MLSTFYTCLTGLNSFSNQLSVISDNLANSETTAYKDSTVSFSELVNSALTTYSSTATGCGVSVQDVTTNWNQGSLSATGGSYDLAITGSGFFVVQDTSGATYYTRNGDFECNANGTLVTSDGLTVQGYTINPDGSLGDISDITLSSSIISPVATSELATSINLNSEAETGDTFSSTISVYDSLGNAIPITITYTKTANANEWTWAASIPSETGTATGSGTLTFDENGDLEDDTSPTISMALSNGSATPQDITWAIYNTDGTTTGEMTQIASASSLSGQSQNGSAAGTLVSISTDEKGIITGTYSNGETQPLYQVALAIFANNNGLNQTGSGLYETTSASGSAVNGVAGSGQFGSITSESLEMSTVDMATELTNMIIAQRAYEACAKMFTVESEIIQTTINSMK